MRPFSLNKYMNQELIWWPICDYKPSLKSENTSVDVLVWAQGKVPSWAKYRFDIGYWIHYAVSFNYTPTHFAYIELPK